jgi:hypothetical protein
MKTRFDIYESFLPKCFICSTQEEKKYLRFQIPDESETKFEYICFSCCNDLRIAFENEMNKKNES